MSAILQTRVPRRKCTKKSSPTCLMVNIRLHQAKQRKGVIRERSKKFELLSGVLHYKDSPKTGKPRLRQV